MGFIFMVTALSSSGIAAEENDASTAGQQIREAVQEKVKSHLDSGSSRNVGIVGRINLITENSIEVISDSREKLTVTTSEETNYVKSASGGSIDRKDLELNSYVLILGKEMPGADVSVEVVQLIEEQNLPLRETLSGTIREIKRNSFILETINRERTVNFFNTTDFRQRKTQFEMIEIKYADLNEGDKVIAGGEKDAKSEQLDAFLVLKLM